MTAADLQTLARSAAVQAETDDDPAARRLWAQIAYEVATWLEHAELRLELERRPVEFSRVKTPSNPALLPFSPPNRPETTRKAKP
jgi:hypothetical protein